MNYEKTSLFSIYTQKPTVALILLNNNKNDVLFGTSSDTQNIFACTANPFANYWINVRIIYYSEQVNSVFLGNMWSG